MSSLDWHSLHPSHSHGRLVFGPLLVTFAGERRSELAAVGPCLCRNRQFPGLLLVSALLVCVVCSLVRRCVSYVATASGTAASRSTVVGPPNGRWLRMRELATRRS